MSLCKLMINFAEYNHWANTRCIEWLSKHPSELLEAEVPSSYSSILKTLNHIWGVESYWYSIIAETTEFERRFNLDAWDIEEVVAGLLQRSRLFAELVPTLSEEDLVKIITVESPWFTSIQPRYEYIQ